MLSQQIINSGFDIKISVVCNCLNIFLSLKSHLEWNARRMKIKSFDQILIFLINIFLFNQEDISQKER